MIADATLMDVTLRITAICDTCRHRHAVTATPLTLTAKLAAWEYKHAGHDTTFISEHRQLPGRFARWITRLWRRHEAEPWWATYRHNADVKLAYAASAAYTCGLATTPLANSATWILGRESTAVSNTTNLYDDYSIGGQVTVGTTPTTATVIEVNAYGSLNDTPLYPDVLDGTDSDETFTSAAIKGSSVRPLAYLGVDATTSNRVYYFGPVALSSAFAGIIPKNHGLFVTHNTGVALNATPGNHILSYTGIYVTVI